MHPPPRPAFSPCDRWTVVTAAAGGLRLTSAHAVLEASVLAEDLFRLRIARGLLLAPRPSWAVSRSDWPSVDIRAKRTASSVSLRTSLGQLSLRLRTGAWEVQDARGLTLFSAPTGGTGFSASEARVALTLAEHESLFGLGETTGTFNKRGLIREFWNSDVLGHAPAIHPGLRNLYVSIPFAISLRDGRAAGLFWDSPARQLWDLGQTRLERWQLTATGGEIDLYLFLGPSIGAVVRRYTELTGRMPLPPRWALGYHQCRYSYESAARLEAVARTFRRKKIPCDALYLDIHHMDGYRVFTFGKTFPQPARLLAKLARQGFKVVTIVDPGVKNDLQFGVLRRGLAGRAFVKRPDGRRDYLGRVWPGVARFPDFLNARTRAWWGREQRRLFRLGVAGIWNDMNEPANFALPTKTLPSNCRHESDHGPLRHAAAHNVYGMQMARAARDGALAQQPHARPFIITRAGYAGVQRHALVWTGDNSSTWEHLADSVQMLLNLGLSGVAFCGADAGGFLDNTTPELLVRWTQLAAFTPFFRNHSNLGTIAQEPWALGRDTEAICRRYIELRYQLLPYLYALFNDARATGAPIMRPLAWHYQNDPVAVAAGDQFLLGRQLLVAPVLRQGAAARSVYLPVDEWFDFWTGEKHRGGQHIVAAAPLEKIPLFVRAGTILPLAAVQPFTGDAGPATINLHVWPGRAGELDWYEDDGKSEGYRSGDTHHRKLSLTSGGRRHALHFSAAQGSFASAVKTWRVILRAVAHKPDVQFDGRRARGRFDPVAAAFAGEVRNQPSPMQIEWR